MEDMRLKMYTPVVTGRPNLQQAAMEQATAAQQTNNAVAANKQTTDAEQKSSFAEILQQQLTEESGVNFSKHAAKRVANHQIELTDDSLNRLNEGVRLAEEKNLDDTLILVGGTAFVVNVKNNMVITAMNSNEMKGNVFTNINGTVIV